MNGNTPKDTKNASRLLTERLEERQHIFQGTKSNGATTESKICDCECLVMRFLDQSSSTTVKTSVWPT